MYCNIVLDGTFSLPSQQLGTASHVGFDFQSRLFYMTGRISGTRFLIETGAEVSVIPSNNMEKLHCSSFHLQAAIKTPITTYGHN